MPESAPLDLPRRRRCPALLSLIAALLVLATATSCATRPPAPRAPGADSRAPPGGTISPARSGPQARSEEEPTLEYQVKASYLYKFLQFVEWPPETFAGGTILICVFGEDNFGAALRDAAGETVRGRTVAVRHFREPEDLEACHIAFLSASERSRERLVLQRLAGRPVLTVGETSGFVERGGTINLVRIADKIRFEINQQAAEHNHLKISAQLLQLGVRR